MDLFDLQRASLNALRFFGSILPLLFFKCSRKGKKVYQHMVCIEQMEHCDLTVEHNAKNRKCQILPEKTGAKKENPSECFVLGCGRVKIISAQ